MYSSGEREPYMGRLSPGSFKLKNNQKKPRLSKHCKTKQRRGIITRKANEFVKGVAAWKWEDRTSSYNPTTAWLWHLGCVIWYPGFQVCSIGTKTPSLTASHSWVAEQIQWVSLECSQEEWNIRQGAVCPFGSGGLTFFYSHLLTYSLTFFFTNFYSHTIFPQK